MCSSSGPVWPGVQRLERDPRCGFEIAADRIP
jgi:hypothetical protein